jgi:hypothetical protein
MIVENFIGRIYESNNFGNFQIIDRGSIDNNFVIRFLDTGFITETSYEAIRHGNVKDKMVPTVADIGFIGSDINITNKKYFTYYKSWNDMINRCYNIIDNDYPLYGGIGITVDPRWYNFTTFYHDCQLLPNYLKKEKYPDHYQLDKDYLQFNIPVEKRVYSRYTCIWISDIDNKILMGKGLVGETGYYGVSYKDNSYCTRLNGKIYGRFTIPEAAAYLYNILYPKYGPQSQFHDIIILNPVKSFTYEELLSYIKPGTKQCWFNDYPR